MKKNLLLFTFLLSVCFVNAQFTKGQKMIGGQLEFNTSNTNVSSQPGAFNKSFIFGISPSFSRFTSASAFNTIGFSYVYNHSQFSIHTPNEQISDLHDFGVYVERMKLEQLAKRFYFTYSGRVGLTYGFGKAAYPITPNNTTEYNNYGVYASAGIGLLYQVNQRFLLSCGLNNLISVYYNHTENKSNSGSGSKNSTNNAGFATGLSNISLNAISIGVKYMLKK
jgi:hypothetical protein